MAEKACKFLREADGYFNNGIVDEKKFNKNNLFILRGPYKNGIIHTCENNYERINALGGYLYQNLENIADNFKGEGDNGNRHIEIFMMWLGDKLYKLENNYTTTLEESYKNNLKESMGVVDYWNLIDGKRAYKIANVWYMSELYSLLNCICSIIIEYNKNPNSKEIGKISPKCYQKFIDLYKNVKTCYSYFHLLKNLKNIYDGFRNVAIRKNAANRKNTAMPSPLNRYKLQALQYVMNASTIPLIELTTSDWNKTFPNASIETLDLHTQACVELRTKIEQKQEKNAPKVPQKAILTSGNKQSGKEENKKTTDRPNPPKPKKPDSSKQKGRPQKRRKPQAQQTTKPPLTPLSPQKQIHQPPEPQFPSASPIQIPSQTDPHVPVLPQPSLSQQSSQQIPPTPEDPPAQNGSSSQTSQTGGSNNSNESKDSGNDKGSIGGTNDNTGDSGSGNENTGGGSSGPTSSTPGGSFDWRSSIFEFILKGKEYYNKASEFIEQNQQKFIDAKDQISNVYKNTVGNLKSAYSMSSSYFSDIISNISSQFNQVVTPPKPGNSGNNLPQNSDKSKKVENPPLPPANPTTTSLPTPSSNPPLPKQPSPQFKPITHQNPQISSSNQQAVGQFVKSLSSNPNLKKTWNIFPTTWNGSGNCKPEIKLMNTTLVCCTSEQCNLTGISVILVLIPIILSIVYKYLSREWTKKSEKKNMKRVIKLVDGNRKTQIIINSHNRNKDLKPVINSVDRKKNPLLNIYKLMQADPIPFINLFFLLIFFVYKRKSDFLEL
ncbi:PIR protein CIR protein [Plasmodium vinckei lentum]|uniref:PIR protein CIR protein n=1 Tax=Plasmodium vinckei lentum TaxID=138297 RepID=A0A6V7RV01_PLAVN|nr:PIR protein CIR protein [Plasmodium vinckei lentum]